MSMYPNFGTDGCSWIANLPDSVPRFLGAPLTIEISDGQGGFSGFLRALETPTLQENGDMVVEIPDLNDRAPDPRYLKVVEKVLSSLDEIVKVAENEFKEYEPDHRELTLIPKIWISEEHMGTNGNRWTLVVEQEDSPIAWHLEFEEAIFREIWSAS